MIIGKILLTVFIICVFSVPLLPDTTYKSSNKSYTMQCTGDMYGIRESCEVTLSTSIVGVHSYLPLIHKIRNASQYDTYSIHLVGEGGDSEGALALTTAMRQSKAYITTIVEGGVYSAHAMISIAGDHITANKMAVFMFHAVSGTHMVNEACGALYEVGVKDRGVSALQKCVSGSNYIVDLFNYYLIQDVSEVLTEEEIQQLKDGQDIYMNSHSLKERLKDKVDII